jgi:hypothetical protein
MGKPTLLKLTQVRTDGGTQSRVAINEATVSEYATVLAEGAVFPPIVIFFDGEHYWLADGFHRVAAHKLAERIDIEADVRDGTQRDAVMFSLTANATHGLPRTQADKQKVITTLLRDAEWWQWSDREIAKRCGVDHKTVGRMRRVVGIPTAERKFTSKHGTVGVRKVEARPMGNFPTDIDEPAKKGPAAVMVEMVAEVERLAISFSDAPVEHLRDAKTAARSAIRAWGKIDRDLDAAIEAASALVGV